jgi:hypothetical protein
VLFYFANRTFIQLGLSHRRTSGHVNHSELDGITHNNTSSVICTGEDHPTHRQDNEDDVSNSSRDESNILDNASDEENDSVSCDLAKRDTKRVLHLKVLVVLFLVLSATIISVVVYTYITHNEQKQFKAKFRNDAEKVHTSIATSIQRSPGALNAIAVTLVSYANDKGIEWPFVALPDFALHASKMLPATNGLYVSVVPIVAPAQKRQWEEFAYQNDIWVNQSLALQEVWNGYQGEIMKDWERSHKLYGSFGDIESNITYVQHRLYVCWLIIYQCLRRHFYPTFSDTNVSFRSTIAAVTCYQNGKAFHLVQHL